MRPNLLNEAGFNFSRGAILSTPIGLTNIEKNPDLAKINFPSPAPWEWCRPSPLRVDVPNRVRPV